MTTAEAQEIQTAKRIKGFRKRHPECAGESDEQVLVMIAATYGDAPAALRKSQLNPPAAPAKRDPRPAAIIHYDQRIREREERAQDLANRFVKFASEIVPLLVQVRKDFFEKGRGEVIFNCRTWREYCETVLRYSQQHINSLIRDENPAAKPKLPAPEENLQVPAPEENLQVPTPAEAVDEQVLRKIALKALKLGFQQIRAETNPSWYDAAKTWAMLKLGGGEPPRDAFVPPGMSCKPAIARFVEGIDEAKAKGLWEFISETWLRSGGAA